MVKPTKEDHRGEVARLLAEKDAEIERLTEAFNLSIEDGQNAIKDARIAFLEKVAEQLVGIIWRYDEQFDFDETDCNWVVGTDEPDGFWTRYAPEAAAYLRDRGAK